MNPFKHFIENLEIIHFSLHQHWCKPEKLRIGEGLKALEETNIISFNAGAIFRHVSFLNIKDTLVQT